jgi:hypothetical protein
MFRETKGLSYKLLLLLLPEETFGAMSGLGLMPSSLLEKDKPSRVQIVQLPFHHQTLVQHPKEDLKLVDA